MSDRLHDTQWRRCIFKIGREDERSGFEKHAGRVRKNASMFRATFSFSSH